MSKNVFLGCTECVDGRKKNKCYILFLCVCMPNLDWGFGAKMKKRKDGSKPFSYKYMCLFFIFFFCPIYQTGNLSGLMLVSKLLVTNMAPIFLKMLNVLRQTFMLEGAFH